QSLLASLGSSHSPDGFVSCSPSRRILHEAVGKISPLSVACRWGIARRSCRPWPAIPIGPCPRWTQRRIARAAHPFSAKEHPMEHLVLTVIAEDQPGLVERLAQCIADHGGNWLESRMSRMAGQFAGILRVAVPSEAHAALTAALQGLQAQGIRVLLAHSGSEPPTSWQEIEL